MSQILEQGVRDNTCARINPNSRCVKAFCHGILCLALNLSERLQFVHVVMRIRPSVVLANASMDAILELEPTPSQRAFATL